MATKVAIIGLGIMGRRMLSHMKSYNNLEADYLCDPNPFACQRAKLLDSKSYTMDSASDAISKADLVYLA